MVALTTIGIREPSPRSFSIREPLTLNPANTALRAFLMSRTILGEYSLVSARVWLSPAFPMCWTLESLTLHRGQGQQPMFLMAAMSTLFTNISNAL